ncbi:MAG: glycogen/starch synthase, partial [Bacteroidales bacterium]|nr:glycogen/starch synthase [Bacteroidales bacterium]
KTCYKDNPLFQDTRLVYSIYNDSFSENLDAKLAQKLAGTGINESYIKNFDNPTYESLIQTAVDFSDAVVVAQENIAPSVLACLDNYPRTIFTHPQTDSYVDDYDKFYDDLMEKAPITF